MSSETLRERDSGLSRDLADEFRELARQKHVKEGTLEIDDDAPVSCGDPGEGCYVQAWVWVDAPPKPECTDPRCGRSHTLDTPCIFDTGAVESTARVEFPWQVHRDGLLKAAFASEQDAHDLANQQSSTSDASWSVKRVTAREAFVYRRGKGKYERAS